MPSFAKAPAIDFSAATGFPDLPKGLENWQPSADSVPAPGGVQDPRFSRDAETEAARSARKRQALQQRMKLANQPEKNGFSPSATTPAPVTGLGAWPAPVPRVSGPPRAATAPALAINGNGGAAAPPDAYIPPHMRKPKPTPRTSTQPASAPQTSGLCSETVSWASLDRKSPTSLNTTTTIHSEDENDYFRYIKAGDIMRMEKEIGLVASTELELLSMGAKAFNEKHRILCTVHKGQYVARASQMRRLTRTAGFTLTQLMAMPKDQLDTLVQAFDRCADDENDGVVGRGSHAA
ncbi:hypothetical protein CC80DRAFT_546013 [Byssothecium circinans]|uniref:Uncharacterized protein n=1 Tax=Byssothecium circinans TaxID=147558 RepID=A0A6A5U405_9PLEO|nr:hypothetical protein CC80DRAFT_546013 [Byssothecium circinans]